MECPKQRILCGQLVLVTREPYEQLVLYIALNIILFQRKMSGHGSEQMLYCVLMEEPCCALTLNVKAWADSNTSPLTITYDRKIPLFKHAAFS